jgi:hypothetical protein
MFDKHKASIVHFLPEKPVLSFNHPYYGSSTDYLNPFFLSNGSTDGSFPRNLI